MIHASTYLFELQTHQAWELGHIGSLKDFGIMMLLKQEPAPWAVGAFLGIQQP